MVADLQGGDTKMQGRPLARVGPLAPGQEQTIKDGFEFFYTPGSAGPPQLALTVDPCDVEGGCRVTELNEQNNTTTGPIEFADAPGR